MVSLTIDGWKDPDPVRRLFRELEKVRRERRVRRLLILLWICCGLLACDVAWLIYSLVR